MPGFKLQRHSRPWIRFGGFTSGIVLAIACSAGDWKVDRTGHEVHVSHDGRPVATHDPDSHGRPVLSVLYSPEGRRLTRGWPMLPLSDGERSDHQHHRGMWFGHGEVNGFDFWADDHRDGDIIQTALNASASDGSATIRTKNDWVSPTGEPVCRDERTFRFQQLDEQYQIDVTVRLIASDGPVHLGDTKEGTFGVRVAGPMKEDSKTGGTITTAGGEHGAEAWGKRAAWVDYSGPTTLQNDEIAGITILDHPDNLNFPARWHVRTYGLFAANPIGEFHFTGGEKTEGFTVAEGETLTLRYRVLLHDGPLDPIIADQQSEMMDRNEFARPDRR